MQLQKTKPILKYFSDLRPSRQWSFAGAQNRKKSTYITHGYHRYPAKFTPQIVESLVRKYAAKDALVCDPFGGCGTTLVESKILGLESVGFDINPMAKLITEAKLEAIDPIRLEKCFQALLNRIESANKSSKIKTNERLQYWFTPDVQQSLLKIYKPITKIRDKKVRNFFLCGFSHILKNCSIWLMKSIKPTRDLNKEIGDPVEIFSKHTKLMIKKNKEFYELLEKGELLNIKSKMLIGDARKLPLNDNTIDLIITSPPYVTSYEYADLHQLSLLWFEYTDNITTFRKRFIGTNVKNSSGQVESSIASSIIGSLEKKVPSLAKSVHGYFSDMNLAIKEMYRTLKKGGYSCIVIGNTELKDIKILNAEVAYQQMLKAGFHHEKIIKREISNQLIAPWRDTNNGRFTSLRNKNKKRVYQYEYVLIMQK